MRIRRAQSSAIWLWLGFWMLCSWALWGASGLYADQARYFYDELGRLIGVVDGQNNAAVYQYDGVGNLLKIERFNTTGGNVGIFLITPASAIAKNPNGTPANKQVEIRGFGYTSPPSSNQVAFNGANATVLSGTGDSLIAIVPAGATTGQVTVTNANGVAVSPQTFTVLVPPIITGIDPSRVPKGTTHRATIEGFNLLDASSIQFSQTGLTATIRSGSTQNNLQINLAIAANVPDGNYSFSVVSPGGTALSGTVAITVTPAVPGFAVGKPVSVLRSFPVIVPPSGFAFDVGLPASVSMP